SMFQRCRRSCSSRRSCSALLRAASLVAKVVTCRGSQTCRPSLPFLWSLCLGVSPLILCASCEENISCLGISLRRPLHHSSGKMNIHNPALSDQRLRSRVLRLCGTPRILSELLIFFTRKTAYAIHPQLRQRVAVYRESVSMP